MSQWQSYPDSTIRETYPAIPRRGGDPNKVLSDGDVAGIASQHAAAVRNEAEFRARQYQRRLQTRGVAAMRAPEDSLMTPLTPIPDDPDLDEYKAAGWLG